MRVALALIGLLSVWLATSGADAQLPPMPDLVISEVLPNSGQGSRDAAFEWVEIENRSGGPISLAGWVLEDNHARDALPEIIVPAGGFVLLAASQDGAEAFAAPAAEIALIVDGRIGNGLANSGDRLWLIDPTGAAVDGLSWSTDHSVTESVAPPPGLSLRRRPGMTTPTVGEPTPGTAGVSRETQINNTPIALMITEIFANAGAGQQDAAFEWIELHNPTDVTVELSGWSLALAEGIWILNVAPTLGRAGSTSLLSRLDRAESLGGFGESEERDSPVRKDGGDGGIPALAIVAIGLGPALAWGAASAWRRRPAIGGQR